jgi:cell division protein ZapD
LVLYEYPFNEEHPHDAAAGAPVRPAGQLMPRDAPVDHHFALATIFEIMDVASRADLKSDLLKELDRHRSQLMGYRGNPHISEAALDEVIGRIDAPTPG